MFRICWRSRPVFRWNCWARGASVVTFDAEREHGALEMTYGLSQADVITLREVATRFSAQRCTNCQPLTAPVSDHCHLLGSLQGSPGAPPLDRIVCMPLGRGNERTGVVSGCLAPGVDPSPGTAPPGRHSGNRVTTALDSARLRARQMATLYAVDRATQERRSLDSLLASVLETTVSGWSVEAGAILLRATIPGTSRVHRGLADEHDATGIGGAGIWIGVGRPRLADQASLSRSQERAGNDPFASTAVLLFCRLKAKRWRVVLGQQRSRAPSNRRKST